MQTIFCKIGDYSSPDSEISAFFLRRGEIALGVLYTPSAFPSDPEQIRVRLRFPKQFTMHLVLLFCFYPFVHYAECDHFHAE
jgi:hypothetical protein